MFDRHQHRAAPFAAHTEALADAQYQQQDRRPDADLVVGRQQADQERADSHDQQREDQHLFAPEAIAEVAEDDPRDRTRDEANQRRPEREHGADQRIERGEEQLVEDQRGEGVVQKEVIPLDGGADGARQRNLANLRFGQQTDVLDAGHASSWVQVG